MLSTNLITTSRISTRTECVSPTRANELADLIEMTGGNAIPLYVKNIGTELQKEFVLIQPDSMKQLSTLAAVRILSDRNPQKWCNCQAVVTNRMNNEGEVIDMTDAILAQL